MGGRRNIDLRISAKMAGVPMWQIAEEMGFSEPTIYRFLNRNLSEPERQRFLSTVARLSAAEVKTANE